MQHVEIIGFSRKNDRPWSMKRECVVVCYALFSNFSIPLIRDNDISMSGRNFPIWPYFANTLWQCQSCVWAWGAYFWKKKTDEWNSFNKNIELTRFFNRGLNFKGCNFKATKIPTQTSRKLIRTNDQTVWLRWAMLWFKIHMVSDGVQHTVLVSKRNLFGNSWDDFPRTKINELRCNIPCCDISAVVFWCFC